MTGLQHLQKCQRSILEGPKGKPCQKAAVVWAGATGCSLRFRTQPDHFPHPNAPHPSPAPPLPGPQANTKIKKAYCPPHHSSRRPHPLQPSPTHPPCLHPLQVNTKIKKAYCPPKVVAGNPCIEYVRYIVMPWFGHFQVGALRRMVVLLNRIFTNSTFTWPPRPAPSSDLGGMSFLFQMPGLSVHA